MIYINILYNCCTSRRIKTTLNIQRKNKYNYKIKKK